MKRDGVELDAAERVVAAAAQAVGRRPMYFDAGGESLFGWYHESPSAEPRDVVAVICPPVGYEYTRSHRSLRHLADRLARRGVPALRFDYHGIGDSPGSDLDPDRLEAWQASIVAAIAQARRLSGRERACLIGVRLGASLAALAAARFPVDLLVLWNACVTGKPYLRELQAIAASAEDVTPALEGGVESGGFVMTAQTRETIMGLDLLAVDFRARRTLVASRDDMPQDKALAPHLAARGIAFDHERLPGWSGMMAEHQFTVVPHEALDRIAAWVEANSDRSWNAALPERPVEQAAAIGDIRESVHRFGEGERLFGILSRGDDSTERPLVILFNAGAVHHVGPNRIYVELARELAAHGVPCLRVDLETLGDSVLDDAWRENYPYPRTAMRDVASAFAFARRELGYSRILAAGLCSGAHMAFHAALDPAHDGLDGILLLNPLVYYWKEGMNLDTSTKFEDMEQYRRSARDPQRWKKLLRGEVKMKRLVEVLAGHAIGLVKPHWDALHEIVFPRSGGTRLSRDLRRLMAMKRPVAFFLGDRDPGLKILNAEAPRALRRGLASRRFVVHSIPGGDHTFSRLTPRRALVRSVVEHCLGAHPRG